MNIGSKLAGIARSPGDPEVIKSGPSLKGPAEHAARALGWFSFGLGMAELIAPGKIARTLGMEGKEGLLRAYGARELAAGRACLSVDARFGMWSRVAGDFADIATLLTAFNNDNPKKKNVGIALAAVVGITLADIAVAQALTARDARYAKGKPRRYSDRSGFPTGVAAARGAASDFKTPPDMRVAPEDRQGHLVRLGSSAGAGAG